MNSKIGRVDKCEIKSLRKTLVLLNFRAVLFQNFYPEIVSILLFKYSISDLLNHSQGGCLYLPKDRKAVRTYAVYV